MYGLLPRKFSWNVRPKGRYPGVPWRVIISEGPVAALDGALPLIECAFNTGYDNAGIAHALDAPYLTGFVAFDFNIIHIAHLGDESQLSIM